MQAAAQSAAAKPQSSEMSYLGENLALVACVKNAKIKRSVRIEMVIPYRAEMHHFNDDEGYFIEGRDLNIMWRVATILMAGEMSRLDGDERRDLGQVMHNALLRSDLTVSR
jgi:hypothetical protein